ncbi:MAG: CinA family protein [Pyrinomonadaceae bacterium]|nr:CinA family protein [Pyrinomonadaceae bacterium]
MATFDGNALKKIMDDQRLTLAVAESLTTGNIQAMIGATSGASTFYRGGLTAYNIDQKVEHLNVERDHAAAVNCVSQRVAIEMAKGVSLSFNCDIGIGTTGYAESSTEQNVSAPHAYFAIWRRNGETSQGAVVAQDFVEGKDLSRVEMQHHVAEVALNALLQYLEEFYKIR